MEELKKQVTRAHRRIVFQKFLSVLAWSLCATFIIALIAIAIPKIWAMGMDSNVWMYSWLGGALGVGLCIALIWAVLSRRGPLDAAIEIDRRFGLKERVSSTFALSEHELQFGDWRCGWSAMLRAVFPNWTFLTNSNRGLVT